MTRYPNTDRTLSRQLWRNRMKRALVLCVLALVVVIKLYTLVQ